jgi:hemin uptake protein HemP
MRKPVVPRILGLLALYCAVFVALVLLQFSKKGNFSHLIGSMVVSGHYRLDAGAPANANEHFLTGDVKVFFGGLEFELEPEYLIRSDDTAKFILPGGTELAFTTLPAGSRPELRIDAVFAEGQREVKIPFQPRRSSVVRDGADGQFTILHNGVQYQFNRTAYTPEDGQLLLNPDETFVSYRVKPEHRPFSPGDYILVPARNSQTFNEAMTRWRDQNFSYWNQTISLRADDDTVIAYSGEALRRGTYKAAVAAVSPDFLAGPRRTYESSVFLGGMDRALRSFTAAEREKTGRITRMINEKSLDFLKENHVFDFLTVRGYANMVNNGLGLIREMDPAALKMELIPGIFEGYIDFRQLRIQGDNPFERLINQACFLVSEEILRDTEKDLVLVSHNGRIDTELNFRLGKALWAWAESAGNADWTALGRSIMLSVLALRDNTGAAPAFLELAENGAMTEAAGGARISAAKIYRILNPGEYYPHAANLGPASNGVWVWTASPLVSAVQEEGALNISVSFPINEIHYVMIRGVRPFGKIQLYSIDYRTDPQFERYDSSGWVYNAQDQILVLKMKHRQTVEHIKIIYDIPDTTPDEANTANETEGTNEGNES